MMLVVSLSLFVSGSYDKIAGSAPGSQVKDENAVNLDQAVMETAEVSRHGLGRRTLFATMPKGSPSP